MADVAFYTKLGCMTAAKQVKLLEDAGHRVDVRDLLARDWSAEELLSYFGDMPVAEWFNTKSPRVKSGEIDPSVYGRDETLTLVLADHLLIHRPLMEANGERRCGFNPVDVHAWIGLGETVFQQSAGEDYFSCSQPPAGQNCP